MPFLELRHIGKSFDAVRALNDVNLSLEPGTVTGLVGDNGAGKSVLINLIGGLIRPDTGEILCGGRRVVMTSPHRARQEGIAVVHQDLALCDDLSAAENIFLGQELLRHYGPLRLIDRFAMQRRAADLFAALDSTTPPAALVRTLSGGQRQATAIARVLLGTPRVVLFDEPTAAISLAQVRDVLDLIARLRDRGIAVLLVSHRMSDIFAVCNRIAVLWRGEKVADKALAETSPEEIAAFITGVKREAA